MLLEAWNSLYNIQNFINIISISSDPSESIHRYHIKTPEAQYSLVENNGTMPVEFMYVCPVNLIGFHHFAYCPDDKL